MTRKLTKLITTSLIASAFIFVGCGDTQSIENGISSIKPHKVTRVLEGDDLPINYEDFAAKIEMHSQIVDDKMFLRMEGKDVQTWDMAHMQVYIDIDYDENTGLSMGSGNYAIVGADYMIEDRQLFKSTSSSDWEWEWVGKVKNAVNSSSGLSDSGDDYTYYYIGTGEKIGHYFKDVTIDTNLLEGLDKEDGMKIRVSMEPINIDWKDTNNYVPAKTINTVYLEGYTEIFDKEYERISDDGKYAFKYESRHSKHYIDFYDIENMQELKSYYVGRQSPPSSINFLDNETVIYNGGIRFKLPEVEFVPVPN